MHIALKSKVLGSGQSHTRCNQTLYHRVICQVHKHGNVLGSSALIKCAAEEIRYVVLHAHSCEYDTELFIGIITQGSLLYQLCCQLIMGQTVSGKDRKLLSTNQSSQTVDSGKSGTDVVTRILTGYRIQRLSVDIPVNIGDDLAQTVGAVRYR